MKKVLLFLIALCFGYWGATHKAELEEHWSKAKGWFINKDTVDEIAKERAELVAEEPVQETPPPSDPAPAAPAPVETPAPPRYEDGMYYTRERISQVTDSGVKVINAGVKVRKVGEEQGQLLVDDGKQRVLTPLSNLTNDPIEIASILQGTAPVPSPGNKTQAGGVKPNSTATTLSTEKAARQANETKYRQYAMQISEITRRIGALTSQVAVLRAEALQAKAIGRPSTYNDRTILSLNQQIAALEAQKSRLKVEQAAIPR